MRIAIIGGHGKVAMLTAPLLAGRGHDVISWIRNPRHADEVEAAGAVAVVADVEVLDTASLAAHLEGCDAVVWSAGAGGGNPERTAAVDRDAAIRSMDAARDAGCRRYVMVSYFGAGPDHGVDPESSFHAYAEAKAAADSHLRRSDLDWTILGPSGLTADPASGLIESGPDVRGGSVSRHDVAAVIAEVLERPATIGATIDFNSGSTPIADVLDEATTT